MSTTLLTADRIRNGDPAQVELIAQYKDDGTGLPVLTICKDWRPTLSRWAKETRYRVEEVPCSCGGRGFILHRDPADVARERERNGDAESEYQVRVDNRQDYSCTCLGCLHHGYRCHAYALLALSSGGFIDNPMDRPSDAAPAMHKPVPVATPQRCKFCRKPAPTVDSYGYCDECGSELYENWKADRDMEEAENRDRVPDLLDSDLELLLPDPDALNMPF